MINYLPDGVIHVEGLELWAHVGVYDKERHLGQLFSLDLSLWIDVDDSAKHDDLSKTVDYAQAINAVRKLTSQLSCLTIECFSERIFVCLEELHQILKNVLEF